MFADNLVRLGFLQSVPYTKPIPTHDNLFAVGKSGPYATFNHFFFLGLGWSWVGEFVGFIKIFIQLHVFQPNPILDEEVLRIVNYFDHGGPSRKSRPCVCRRSLNRIVGPGTFSESYQNGDKCHRGYTTMNSMGDKP